MKQVFLICTTVLLLAACGREPSVAEKSADAYRDARAKGTPVGGGHDHGAAATTPAATSAAVDHSTMDHSAHGGSAAAPVDHSAHGATPGAATSSDPHAGHTMATTGSRAASADPHAGHTMPASGSRAASADPHAGHAMSATTPRAPSADPHAGHRMPATTPRVASADPHAGHTMPTGGAAAAQPAAGAPRTSTDIQRVQPAATLKPDAFDAPAPASVAESRKATQGGGHEGHGAPGTSAALYACPMHPEVTSDKPGTCPKCGMALVKKD